MNPRLGPGAAVFLLRRQENTIDKPAAQAFKSFPEAEDINNIYPHPGKARRVNILFIAAFHFVPERAKARNPKNLPAKHAKGTLNIKGKYFLFFPP